MVSTESLQKLQRNFPHSNKEKPSDFIYQKLLEVQQRVSVFLSSPNPEEFSRIVTFLDEIKASFVSLDVKNLSVLLNEIRSLDKKRWKEYTWERVDFQSSHYHENNQEWAFIVEWITADNIVSIAHQYKDPKDFLIHIILNLAKIYWLTSEILRYKK